MAPHVFAAPDERHVRGKGRRIGARRRSLDDEAAALAGGALGQHVFQLARGKALQGDLAGRGRADDADLRGGQGVDGGNLHVSADALEFEDNFTRLWHGVQSGSTMANETLTRLCCGFITAAFTFLARERRPTPPPRPPPSTPLSI